MEECDLVSPVRDERQRPMFCRPSRDLLVTFASPPARTCWAIVESSLAGLAGREIAGEPVGVSPRTHPRCELSGGERRPARRLAFEPNITGESAAGGGDGFGNRFEFLNAVWLTRQSSGEIEKPAPSAEFRFNASHLDRDSSGTRTCESVQWS